jgi:hypothetical protein
VLKITTIRNIIEAIENVKPIDIEFAFYFMPFILLMSDEIIDVLFAG